LSDGAICDIPSELVQGAVFQIDRAGVSLARITFIVLAILGVLTGGIFDIDPSLDLQGASFFRDLLAQPEMRPFDRVIDLVRQVGPLFIVAAIAPATVALVMKLFWPKRSSPMSARAALFLVISLTLGPGLLVNGVLKEGWARPRPGMVTEFGGDYAFKPWWDPRGTCDSNCSFVSGETSSAVWMTAPALLVPAPWRYVALGAAALYAVTVAFMRLLVGGHFLSDVIFAAIFTGLVMWTVHGSLFRWPAIRPDDCALDAALEKCGRGMGRLFAGFAPSRDARPDKPAPPA
jgi:lipid A 4'-phosphatase